MFIKVYRGLICGVLFCNLSLVYGMQSWNDETQPVSPIDKNMFTQQNSNYKEDLALINQECQPVFRSTLTLETFLLKAQEAYDVLIAHQYALKDHPNTALERLEDAVQLFKGVTEDMVDSDIQDALSNCIDLVKKELETIEVYSDFPVYEKNLFEQFKISLDEVFKERFPLAFSYSHCEAKELTSKERVVEWLISMPANASTSVSSSTQTPDSESATPRTWSPFSPCSNSGEEFFTKMIKDASRSVTPIQERPLVSTPAPFVSGVVLQKAPKRGLGITVWESSFKKSEERYPH